MKQFGTKQTFSENAFALWFVKSEKYRIKIHSWIGDIGLFVKTNQSWVKSFQKLNLYPFSTNNDGRRRFWCY